ncbi:Extracellular ligand-binding receptor [Tepidanaerobacter acetatoxydans Re1]|uniref:Extracellular ligand-binding receptor n=1 Tax=Tepidanaerobacter acetatoxydans (strain DSM 21804 / JCM 16047 / Re1) TaxID=1209989 RepID=F4LXL5_TEPAE|nr:ABC transporter substrate-binding protein [Tepidanaerobacter acetatoxydans]AEE91944.1 Extracellular ligand-binding receptor [Tepidanaerobacter acetatoxydans Re1]CCP26772.1 Extracellular ligand-binding receptor [Tepidanaerobacter acetatoxydans Re1]
MVKKIIFTIIALVMVITIVGCGSTAKKSETQISSEFDGEIRIGVVTAITGSFPLAGERTKQSVQMRCDEINENGGLLGKKVVIVVEDDQSTQTGAVNAVNKIINDNIVALIGPHLSGNVMAVDQILKNAGMPFLTGGTSPKLSELGNPYLFRIRPSDTMVAEAAAKYAVEKLGAEKVGISYNNDDFGIGGKNVIESYLKYVGIEYVAEGHNSGDKDLTGQIMKFKNANVDAIISWTHDSEVALFARQTYELNLGKPIIASAGITMQQVLDMVDSEEVEGWYSVTDFAISDESSVVQDFVKRFEAKYNVKPELYAASYYGAMTVLADAIERAGSTDPDAIRKALAETQNVQGIIGTFNCNELGDMINEAKIVQIKNKVPNVIDTVFR